MKGSVAISPCEWDEKEFGSRPFVTVALVSRNLDLWSECESDKKQRNCIEFKWTGLQVRIKWSPYFKAGVQIYSDLWSLLVGTKPKYFWQSKDFFRAISSYETRLQLFDLTVGRWNCLRHPHFSSAKRFFELPSIKSAWKQFTACSAQWTTLQSCSLSIIRRRWFYNEELSLTNSYRGHVENLVLCILRNVLGQHCRRTIFLQAEERPRLEHFLFREII